MSNFQDFGLAKEQFKNLFLGIQDYADSACEHIIFHLSETCPDVIDRNELNHLLDYRFKVNEMYEVFTHSQMKVGVFGRTSSGKSTVVNAMLGENVLPSGIGHATNSFLQIEGSLTRNAYLWTEGLPIEYYVESATDLAYILNNYIQPNPKQLPHVCWPKEKCLFLKDDVVLVDSPGIDTTPCLDEWIYDHYINVDAFVLVVNAESTSMDIEMNFLHKILRELPNANIFILFNRMDEYEFFDQKRKQKIEENIDLLDKKLEEWISYGQYCQKFFISAKEVLKFRVEVNSGLNLSMQPFFERYLEFIEFERQLENWISRSALLKFFNYSMQGKYMLSEISTIMDIINCRCLEQRHLNMIQEYEIEDALNVSEEQLQIITITNSPTTAFNSFDDSLAVEQNLPLKSSDGKTQFKLLGGIILAGIVTYKTIGWSPMIAAGAIYGGLCLYEYLSSTKKAKEESLKRQYNDHATSTVQSSVGFTSANYSEQVQQELPTAFEESDQLFEELAINSNEEMTHVKSDLNILTTSIETPKNSSTKKAKEESLKRQYDDHATSTVQSSVDFTSANYSEQVQQGLPTTFEESDQLFDDLAININEEMTHVNSDLNILTTSIETPNIFRSDEVFWLNEHLNQLNSFLMDKIHFFN